VCVSTGFSVALQMTTSGAVPPAAQGAGKLVNAFTRGDQLM